MNEILFGRKVRQALDEGLRVAPHVAERLRAARERALAVQRREQPAQGFVRSGRAGVLARLGGWVGFSWRVLLPLAVTLAGLAGMHRWQQEQRALEVEELDARLLADDLPIEAYLDKGFEAWLRKRTGG